MPHTHICKLIFIDHYLTKHSIYIVRHYRYKLETNTSNSRSALSYYPSAKSADLTVSA